MPGPFVIFLTVALLCPEMHKIFLVSEGSLCCMAGTTSYDSNARRYLPLTT
jgi:hypothetical protein